MTGFQIREIDWVKLYIALILPDFKAKSHSDKRLLNTYTVMKELW